MPLINLSISSIIHTLQVQLTKTPQITFGIKHSPLLGQLKPVEPLRRIPSEETQRQSVKTASQTEEKNVTRVQANNEIIQQRSNTTQDVSERMILNESTSTDAVQNTRTQVTHLRADSELRSSTVTPEPIQSQEVLTQELVWIPEQPIRRGSYTIDKADGFTERFHSDEVVPVENGLRRVAAAGERGAFCTEENSSHVVKRDGFEQNVQKSIKNASAHERSQAATEEVRSGTEVQHLPNGGIAKTTTTTTIRKVGTAAKTANASTTVTRTATAVTSRDIGVK